MKPVLIDCSQQDKQLWPGAGDSLTAFVKMDIGSGYAAVLRYGSRRMRTSVSMSESTKQGSKSADLVQILAVCTNAARSTEAGQLRILISALSAWAAAVEPFMARVTVRLLPEILVTRICNAPIRAVWPISSWVPPSTATVVLVVSMEAPLRSVLRPSKYRPYPQLFAGCKPVGLISFKASLQCSVETAPMLGGGGIVGLKPVIANGPGFFEREVVVVVLFQGRTQD